MQKHNNDFFLGMHSHGVKYEEKQGNNKLKL